MNHKDTTDVRYAQRRKTTIFMPFCSGLIAHPLLSIATRGEAPCYPIFPDRGGVIPLFEGGYVTSLYETWRILVFCEL